MNNEQIKRIIDDSYDESKEEGLRSIARDFYSRQHVSSVIAVWLIGGAHAALAIYSALQFFRTDQTKWQIMYAALFLVGVHGIDLMKNFAWQMAHRRNIKRELKRLELRVAELNETLRAR
jgi:hypothetical protein